MFRHFLEVLADFQNSFTGTLAIKPLYNNKHCHFISNILQRYLMNSEHTKMLAICCVPILRHLLLPVISLYKIFLSRLLLFRKIPLKSHLHTNDHKESYA